MQNQIENHAYLNAELPTGARVGNLLSQMTLPEKIGQMTQAEVRSSTPEDIETYFIGSVLSGGGANPMPNSPESWSAMVRGHIEAGERTRLGIPVIYGADAVHGHNNVVGATIFPHNIGLGATRDADLVRRIGQATAVEMLSTHVLWNFAPAVSVPQDIRWGRTYEGYSEDTGLVTELSHAFIDGLERQSLRRVLASAKHYIGDGGTAWGSTRPVGLDINNPQAASLSYKLDQGDMQVDEETWRTLHLPPYVRAIESGVLNIMVSLSSWNGEKCHGHRYLLTDVIKNEFGFKGFLVSDWMGISHLAGDYYSCVVRAINAGLDMIMEPDIYKRFIKNLTRAVEAGDVPIERIDDAVSRILWAKFEMGLFENPYGDEALLPRVGCAEHRELAREAVRKSLVLLKNEKDCLPLVKNAGSILIAGRAADSIGDQCGGWTIEWQGEPGRITPGTSFLDAVQNAVSDGTCVHYQPEGDFTDLTGKAEIGIIVASETPYAEGVGDEESPRLKAEEAALIEQMRGLCDRLVLVIFSGRPLIVTDELPLCDAVVAAWLPGTEGAGLTDVIFGDYPFVGKLSYAWPRSMTQIPRAAMLNDADAPLFPFGFGLTT